MKTALGILAAIAAALAIVALALPRDISGLVFYFVLLFQFWGIYLVPVFAVPALIMYVIEHLAGWRHRVSRALLFVLVFYLGLLAVSWLSLAIWTGAQFMQGSTRYEQIGNSSPQVISAETLTGFDNVSLGILGDDDGTSAGELVSPSANDIISAQKRKSGPDNFNLRLITTKPGITWTLKPGEGVSLYGDMTMPPGTWREFEVSIVGDKITIRSTGTGNCTLGQDPNGCRR